EKIAPLLQRARADYRLDQPAAAIPALLEAEHAIRALPDDPIRARKLDEIRRVIAACAGVYVEASAVEYVTTPGAELKVTTSAIKQPIVHRWVDPVAGERWRPVEILPPVTLSVSAPLMVFPDSKTKELRVRVHASAGAAEGAIAPQAAAGFTVEPASLKYALA